MFAAIYIAECSTKEEKEDSEAFALVHRHTRKSVNDMILMVDGGKLYLMDGCSVKEGERK